MLRLPSVLDVLDADKVERVDNPLHQRAQRAQRPVVRVLGSAIGPRGCRRIEVNPRQRAALPAPRRGVVVAVCGVVQPAPVCVGRDMLVMGSFTLGAN